MEAKSQIVSSKKAEKLVDDDFVCFFEDETKLKTLSEIQLPLKCEKDLFRIS